MTAIEQIFAENDLYGFIVNYDKTTATATNGIISISFEVNTFYSFETIRNADLAMRVFKSLGITNLKRPDFLNHKTYFAIAEEMIKNDHNGSIESYMSVIANKY